MKIKGTYLRKKKPTKKKVYKKAPKATISRSIVTAGKGFPQKMIMTHKYFECQDITNTAGSTGTYNFRANSMFDPNITGTGHQPYYFDQMSAIYNHFFVLGSKITVTVQHDVTTNSTAVACVYLNDDTTVTPTYYALQEQNKARFVTIPTGSNNPFKISCNYSARKTFGPGTLANTSLKGSGSADCSEAAVYTIAVFPQDIASTQNYNITVMIEYIAVWLEVKDLGIS